MPTAGHEVPPEAASGDRNSFARIRTATLLQAVGATQPPSVDGPFSTGSLASSSVCFNSQPLRYRGSIVQAAPIVEWTA